MINCYLCGTEIFFHDRWLSRNGKKIPLCKDVQTGKWFKHRCPANPYVPKREKHFRAYGPRVIYHE